MRYELSEEVYSIGSTDIRERHERDSIVEVMMKQITCVVFFKIFKQLLSAFLVAVLVVYVCEKRRSAAFFFKQERFRITNWRAVDFS